MLWNAQNFSAISKLKNLRFSLNFHASFPIEIHDLNDDHEFVLTIWKPNFFSRIQFSSRTINAVVLSRHTARKVSDDKFKRHVKKKKENSTTRRRKFHFQLLLSVVVDDEEKKKIGNKKIFTQLEIAEKGNKFNELKSIASWSKHFLYQRSALASRIFFSSISWLHFNDVNIVSSSRCGDELTSVARVKYWRILQNSVPSPPRRSLMTLEAVEEILLPLEKRAKLKKIWILFYVFEACRLMTTDDARVGFIFKEKIIVVTNYLRETVKILSFASLWVFLDYILWNLRLSIHNEIYLF